MNVPLLGQVATRTGFWSEPLRQLSSSSLPFRAIAISPFRLFFVITVLYMVAHAIAHSIKKTSADVVSEFLFPTTTNDDNVVVAVVVVAVVNVDPNAGGGGEDVLGGAAVTTCCSVAAAASSGGIIICSTTATTTTSSDGRIVVMAVVVGGASAAAGTGIPVELSKMSTQLFTVDNCVDSGHLALTFFTI
jgi:hypothetical protein